MDLKGCFFEASQDQYWSRYLQQKTEECSELDLEIIFSEILPGANDLITDVFGNYII